MTALLLAVALYIYFALVGQGVIAAIKPRIGLLFSWFISPALGLAVATLLLTRLSVNGLAIRSCAPWVALALPLLSLFCLRKRCRLPWRQLMPFFAVLLLYIFYIGWPLLEYGFRWISYGNDDMANYCLAASRFMDHGYYDLPLRSELEGSDYTQYFWFMHALGQMRPGSELLLAEVAAVTRRNPLEIFMPTTIALSLIQLSSLAALALHRGRNRRIALYAFIILAACPFFALGTLYQLIAQVAGVAVLLAACALLLVRRRFCARTAIVSGLIVASLGILYPEVAPFVALSIAAFYVRQTWKDRRLDFSYSWFVGATAVLTFVFLASTTYEFLHTLLAQVGGIGNYAVNGRAALFPWALLPSFLPMVEGFLPFGNNIGEPWMSIDIAGSIILIGILFYKSIVGWLKGTPAGNLGIVIFALTAFLFKSRESFGLFKLGMYSEPVFALLLAHFLLDPPNGLLRRLAPIGLCAIVLATASTFIYYTEASLGIRGGLAEVPMGSRLGVKFKLPAGARYDAIESDIANIPIAKLLMQYTRGVPTYFLSQKFIEPSRLNDSDWRSANGPSDRLTTLRALHFLLPTALFLEQIPYEEKPLLHFFGNTWKNTIPTKEPGEKVLFVTEKNDLNHFNKANPGENWSAQGIYQFKPLEEVKDRLVFIDSDLGSHYYTSRINAAVFAREAEPLSNGSSFFHGTGKVTLFEILNPSPEIRLLIDFTRTNPGAGQLPLPHNAILIGAKNYRLPFVGHGSARIASPSFEPAYIQQTPFITLDFAEKPQQIVVPKKGLMRLYGQAVNIDSRNLIGFTRDISIITEEQYKKMRRPTRLSRFPQDLLENPGLEYSGIFEDGWISEEAFFSLGRAEPGQEIFFKGLIPDLPKFRDQGLTCSMRVNDEEPETFPLKPGYFMLHHPVHVPSEITRVYLSFSTTQPSDPIKDPRPISALVQELSIAPASIAPTAATDAEPAKTDLKKTGVDSDGWLASTASIITPSAPAAQLLQITVEVPGWAGIPDNEISISLDGHPYREQSLNAGMRQTFSIPLSANAAHTIELKSTRDFGLPGETRRRSFFAPKIALAPFSTQNLFTSGISASGFQFKPSGIDADGWVDQQASFTFPRSDQFKFARVKVVGYPGKTTRLEVASNQGSESHVLESITPITVKLPLSDQTETRVSFRSETRYPLAAPDTRSRSYRIVDIDFQ